MAPTPKPNTISENLLHYYMSQVGAQAIQGAGEAAQPGCHAESTIVPSKQVHSVAVAKTSDFHAPQFPNSLPGGGSGGDGDRTVQYDSQQLAGAVAAGESYHGHVQGWDSPVSAGSSRSDVSQPSEVTDLHLTAFTHVRYDRFS